MEYFINKVCHIFGAGEQSDFQPAVSPGDFVIAADGGLLYAEKLNIGVDLIVGDFDSLGTVPHGDNVIALPQEKDDTDMAAAIGEGVKRGFNTFRIYGGTGGRLDHTLANIQCLAMLAEKNLRGLLYDKSVVVAAVHNGYVTFPASAAGTVSAFAHSDSAAGVYEKGLKYKLEDAELKNTFPLGVSNEFMGVESRISVQSGTLLVVYPNDIEVIAYENGSALMEPEAVDTLIAELVPLADLITPNIPETEKMTGIKIETQDDF